MKKRWFAIALTLCLTLALMTVTASAKPVKYGCQIDPEDYPDLKTFPATYIALSASVPSADTCDNAPGASINVHSLQYPADGNYHKMVLKLSIPSHKCGTCYTITGPFNDLTVTFESDSYEYFCHSYNYVDGINKNLKLTSSAQTESGDKIDFEILLLAKNRNGLKRIQKTDPTCTTDGISQDCWHCDVCDKYFSDAEGKNEIDTPVLSALGHDFDKVTGKCSRCDVRATASLNDVFKESLAAAVEDYNTGNGGTLRAFVTPEGDVSFTLKKSGTLIVPAGVTIPKIVLEEGPTVTIENAGTISAIETSPAGTLTINNSGTVGAIQMNPAGTLTVDNSGEITSIKTPIRITGGGTRTLGITNHSSGVIEQIEAPNTMITVQNDGTVGELTGYFYPDDKDTSRENMVTLKRGAGVYTKIQSVGPWSGEGYATKTADYSKLLSDGDYFYLPGKATPWQRGESYDIIHAIVLKNVYFTGLPIDSVDVTGAANGTSLPLTPDEENRPSMTVEVGQTVTLNGGFTVPETAGLKSDKANITYSWRCKHAGSTTSGSGQSYTLKDIQYGTYELMLTVTDSQYHYAKSLTFYLYAEQPEGQKTQICLKTPTGTFTKKYDATTRAPEDLKIEFYDGNNNPITVPEDCYTKIVAYKDLNCSDNNEITATVSLTEKGAKVYNLGTDGTATFTVPAAITRAEAVYQLSQTEVTARVGKPVFPCLALTGTGFLSDGNHGTISKNLFGTVSIEQDIMVEGAPLSITFYRLHPGNIVDRGRYSTISPGDFIHDPSMNEELTADSTFAAAGEYYVYAVVQPTRNYKPVEETTSCIVIQVQETEDSAKHHEGSAAWDGTITATKPIATGETKSVYLSGSLPTVYTELLLSQKKNLTLCLNGKTLSATNSITSYNHIRVTDNAALTIVDCTGTGVVKGTVPATVNGGAGGIAYVADGGTITIKGGKLTGGVASTGGAIVVDAGGILNIEGGEISGNLVQTGNGGAIYVKNGGVVNMTGGVIRNNQVLDGNGGAIYVEAGGTVNLFGGTISGNSAGGLGGGIYVEEGGTLNVQGAPEVTGNTAGGKENNVYLPAGQRIAITESGLTLGAEIGVTSESGTYPVLIANAAQDASAQFIADDKNAAVICLNGALSLVQKPAVAAAEDESTVTVSVGTNYLPDSVVIMLVEYAENGQLVRVQTATVAPKQGEYTFQRTAGTWVRCFLLRQDHTPLTPALAPRV